MTSRTADIKEAEARGMLMAAHYIRKYWKSRRLISREADAVKTIERLVEYASWHR